MGETWQRTLGAKHSLPRATGIRIVSTAFKQLFFGPSIGIYTKSIHINHYVPSVDCFAMSYPCLTYILFPEAGETAIDRYVTLVKTHGWTSESVAAHDDLKDYRLVKANYCKDTKNRSEHEFLTHEFVRVGELENKLVMRIDRHVGAHKETPSSSFLQALSSLSYPSSIGSDRYLARDTILRIQGLPDNCKVFKTITFNPDSSSCPNLWDVVVLVRVVHDNSPFYTLQARQCYWFTDTIFGTLQKWADFFKNGIVESYEEVKRGRHQASVGKCGIFPVHRRNPDHMDGIWGNLGKELRDMSQQVRIFI
jgi:hypothetical protein